MKSSKFKWLVRLLPILKQCTNKPYFWWLFGVRDIVIKPGLGVDLAKGSDPGFHGSTRVNPKKLKKKIKVLIFYMKKLRKNPCKYRLYIL